MNHALRCIFLLVLWCHISPALADPKADDAEVGLANQRCLHSSWEICKLNLQQLPDIMRSSSDESLLIARFVLWKKNAVASIQRVKHDLDWAGGSRDFKPRLKAGATLKLDTILTTIDFDLLGEGIEEIENGSKLKPKDFSLVSKRAEFEKIFNGMIRKQFDSIDAVIGACDKKNDDKLLKNGPDQK